MASGGEKFRCLVPAVLMLLVSILVTGLVTGCGGTTKVDQKPGASQPAQKPVEIRIGHGFAAEEQLWLMKARPDLTPNQGKAYTLTFTPFRANSDRFNAFQAGQIDGGTAAANTAIFARAQGIKLKAVASISREARQGFQTTFLAREDSGIKTARDLKGKTVGIVDYRSSTDMWARQGLISAGLNPDKDAKLVVVPFPAMGDALRSKKIDAGAFVQPFYTVEKQKGGLVEVFKTKDVIPFDEELMLVWFGEDFLKSSPKAVRAFLADYARTSKWYVENTKEAKKTLIEAKLVQTQADLYINMSDWNRNPNARVDIDSMKKVQDLIIQAGWLEKPIKIEDLVDLSYLP